MKRILIAEDDAANRELLREIVEACGYVAVEAATGLQAFSRFMEHPPDLAILDVQLPELDGLSLARQLRSDPRFSAIPLISMTAYAMRGDRERVLEAGFDLYLTKPIDVRGLREHLRRLCTPVES
jgi:two-component system cell cycle response regulator DivK